MNRRPAARRPWLSQAAAAGRGGGWVTAGWARLPGSGGLRQGGVDVEVWLWRALADLRFQRSADLSARAESLHARPSPAQPGPEGWRRSRAGLPKRAPAGPCQLRAALAFPPSGLSWRRRGGQAAPSQPPCEPAAYLRVKLQSLRAASMRPAFTSPLVKLGMVGGGAGLFRHGGRRGGGDTRESHWWLVGPGPASCPSSGGGYYYHRVVLASAHRHPSPTNLGSDVGGSQTQPHSLRQWDSH
jgi:hypothetical protein